MDRELFGVDLDRLSGMYRDYGKAQGAAEYQGRMLEHDLAQLDTLQKAIWGEALDVRKEKRVEKTQIEQEKRAQETWLEQQQKIYEYKEASAENEEEIRRQGKEFDLDFELKNAEVIAQRELEIKGKYALENKIIDRQVENYDWETGGKAIKQDEADMQYLGQAMVERIRGEETRKNTLLSEQWRKELMEKYGATSTIKHISDKGRELQTENNMKSKALYEYTRLYSGVAKVMDLLNDLGEKGYTPEQIKGRDKGTLGFWNAVTALQGMTYGIHNMKVAGVQGGVDAVEIINDLGKELNLFSPDFTDEKGQKEYYLKLAILGAQPTKSNVYPLAIRTALEGNFDKWMENMIYRLTKEGKKATGKTQAAIDRQRYGKDWGPKDWSAGETAAGDSKYSPAVQGY